MIYSNIRNRKKRKSINIYFVGKANISLIHLQKCMKNIQSSTKMEISSTIKQVRKTAKAIHFKALALLNYVFIS